MRGTMRWPDLPRSPALTALTLAVGGAGALAFWALSAPVYMLMGPAVAVSVAGLGGLRTAIDPRLRDVCFVVVGVAVGSGFDNDALAAMLRWPLAFAFMALLVVAILAVSQAALSRLFRFDARSAVLASAPGHLSFVIAVASEGGSDIARISITQSVRLLLLTLVVPFAAVAMGVDLAGTITPPGPLLAPGPLIALLAISPLVGWVFGRWGVPAPLLLGAMVTSALGHLSGLAPGVLPGWLILPAYLVLGSLIGTRFSGISLAHFTSGLAAGLTVTLIAVGLATLWSLPVAWALDMPLAHVLVAFAPGGLETMIAMGVVLGVVPGFVAACHIARLLVLSVVLPWWLSRLARRVRPGP